MSTLTPSPGSRPSRPERTEPSAFAHAVSHDLRVPLSNIVSAADFLLEEAKGEAAADLRLIRRNALRAVETIRKLVEYADTTNPLPPAEPVDLEDIVDAALETLGPLIRERRASIDRRTSLGRCAAPRGALVTVLRCVIENAILYHPPGATAAVELGPLPLRLHGVFVRDRGVGVPLEDRVRVFEPFVRLKEVSGVEGAGVGLATARNLAQAMGGDVRFSDAVLVAGTRVEVQMPAAPACEAQSKAPASGNRR